MFRKVNFRVLAVFLLISTVFVYNFAYSHPGRTDANGGHTDRKTGKYHYHGGAKPPVLQLMSRHQHRKI